MNYGSPKIFVESADFDADTSRCNLVFSADWRPDRFFSDSNHSKYRVEYVSSFGKRLVITWADFFAQKFQKGVVM